MQQLLVERDFHKRWKVTVEKKTNSKQHQRQQYTEHTHARNNFRSCLAFIHTISSWITTIDADGVC